MEIRPLNKERYLLNLSGDYQVINFGNKIKVILKVLWELDKVFILELYKLKNHLKSANLAKLIKNFAGDLIFKLGLIFHGVRWQERFSFKSSHLIEAQKKVLKDIIKENKTTQFGKDHHFDQIDSIESFRSQIEVQTYETLKPYIDQHLNGKKDSLVKGKPISYATTSGTTGEPKYIPITPKTEERAHKAVSRLWAYQLYKDNPKGFEGKILTIVSPAEEGRTPDGTVYGSTSGQFMQGMSRAIRKKYALPYEVFTIEDYDSRYYTILRLAMMQDVTFISTANPSTLVLLAKKSNQWKERLIKDIRKGTLCSDLKLDKELRNQLLESITPQPELADKLEKSWQNDEQKMLRPKHYWSNLSTIGCWTGGNSGTFLKELNSLYGEALLRDLGYLASEIRGSIPFWSETNSGVLTIHQNFFEFVKVEDMEDENPTFLTADQLHLGQRYYIFITTKAGLYRYNINDIIEVTGFYNDTPSIVFVQKGKGVTNITGEKLYEEQLMAAVKNVSEQTGLEVNFYMALANVEKSKYELFTEFNHQEITTAQKELFIKRVDAALSEINLEYEAKRKSLRLAPIALKVLTPGAFELFKQQRISQGVREAQLKVEPLTEDPLKVGMFQVVETI